ncbi:MAG TPA: VOC family protein [Stellaceae bacterium]|nr:VOC family protein [Stellaceae bacterium]
MTVQALNHYNVQTTDLEATRAFYEKVLGFKIGPRPNFDFPGYWLYCGEMPVVHLTGGHRARTDNPADTGNFDHIAFTADDFEGMKRHFREVGIPFREQKVPGARVWQLFVHDPNKVMIELNFAPS